MASRFNLVRPQIALDSFKKFKGEMEQTAVAQFQKNVKSGKIDDQILKFVKNRQNAVYDLSAAYFTTNLKIINSMLKTGFPLSRQMLLSATRANPKFYPIHEERTYLLGYGGLKEKVVIESGRQNASPWANLPMHYIAVRGKRSKAPGSLINPYGKWKGLPAGSGSIGSDIKPPAFWLKNGVLREQYKKWIRGWLAANNTAVSRVPWGWREAKKNIVEPTDKKKQLFSVQFAVKFPALGNPILDKLIRQSFATMRPTRHRVYVRNGLGELKGGPVSVDMLAYSEQSRPFVARLSAQMGRKQRAALKELMKRL